MISVDLLAIKSLEHTLIVLSSWISQPFDKQGTDRHVVRYDDWSLPQVEHLESYVVMETWVDFRCRYVYTDAHSCKAASTFDPAG